jgi:glycopeptide antibiotics resistance protein
MSSDAFHIISFPAGLKPRSGLLWFWLAVLVLTPMFPLSNFVGHPHWASIRWVPFQDSSFSLGMIIDVLGNTAWFIPFGYLLHYWTKENASPLQSIATVAVVACGVSLLIEFFQVFCHNRVPSLTDVVCNVLGAGVGGYFAERHRASLTVAPVRCLVIEGDGSRALL